MLQGKIKKFLESETQTVISDTGADLIKSGVLDSFLMIKLIHFIELELGVRVDMDDLTPENFNSIANINKVIQSHGNTAH